MPQMNPIWWTSLFIMFILILLITNSMTYYFKNNFIIKNDKNNFTNKFIYWKW